MKQKAAPCRARKEALEFGYEFHFLEKLFSWSKGAKQIPMPRKEVLDGTVTARRFFSENHLKRCVARQDSDCANGNKDVRIEAMLLIPRQQAKPNQAVKSRFETARIWLYDTYKQYGSSPINGMPQHGQIPCLGLDLN